MSDGIKVEYITGHDGQQIDVSHLSADCKDYYTTDIYKPKVLPPRAKQLRDTFFEVVDDMRRRLETDDIFDADAFIKKLEDMKPDIDYLCTI